MPERPPSIPQVSLILPCYNEMEHIEQSFDEIRRFLASIYPHGDYEIILVDDGSTDGTRHFLNQLRENEGEDSNIRIELNARNLGRGGAVKRGMQLARAPITGFMDIDREVSEVFIPKFVQQIQSGADLAIGKRVYTLSWSPHFLLRHLLSVGYKELVRAWLRVPARDSEAGYKFFSGRALQAILEQSQFDNWFWDTEVSLICSKANLRLIDVPVLFIRDPNKSSTVRIFRDTSLYLRAIARFQRLCRQGFYGVGNLTQLER